MKEGASGLFGIIEGYADTGALVGFSVMHADYTDGHWAHFHDAK